MIPIDLRSSRLRIRRAAPDDAASWFTWFADPSVTLHLPLAGKSVLPLESIESFLAQAAASDRPELAVTIELNSEGPIGCGGFRNFDEHAAEVSLVIGQPRLWGRGLGREALRLLLEFGFTDLGLTSMWLIVRTDNEPALQLFRSDGFTVVEHRQATVLVDGVQRDKYKMQLSKVDYERLATFGCTSRRRMAPYREPRQQASLLPTPRTPDD